MAKACMSTHPRYTPSLGLFCKTQSANFLFRAKSQSIPRLRHCWKPVVPVARSGYVFAAFERALHCAQPLASCDAVSQANSNCSWCRWRTSRCAWWRALSTKLPSACRTRSSPRLPSAVLVASSCALSCFLRLVLIYFSRLCILRVTYCRPGLHLRHWLPAFPWRPVPPC